MGSSFAACWHTGRRVLLAQEAPGVPQEHAGMARRSSWLDVGIPDFMAKGGQEQSRKLQEEPKSTEE